MRKYRNYKEFSANYLGGWTFADGDKTLTIKDVDADMVRSKDGGTEEKICVWFEEYNLPMILNSTNNDTIKKIIGHQDFDEWIGKQIVVGTKKVRAFGDIWDAIRVKDEIPAPVEEYICERCGQVIKEGKRLAMQTRADFGQELCLDCARKAKAEQNG